MTRQAIIERTVRAINQLPDDKAVEISDFADFIAKRYEEDQLSKGVQKLGIEASSFDFLRKEDDLYTLSDVKEVYNAKR